MDNEDTPPQGKPPVKIVLTPQQEHPLLAAYGYTLRIVTFLIVTFIIYGFVLSQNRATCIDRCAKDGTCIEACGKTYQPIWRL